LILKIELIGDHYIATVELFSLEIDPAAHEIRLFG
jgi:hypothetical protein